MLDGQWAELARGVLRKSRELDEGATPADAEARLRTLLPDGIAVQALYLNAGRAPDPGLPGQAPYLRGESSPGPLVTGWDVRQLHDDPDLGATRAAIRDDLEHGVRSLWLRLGAGAIPVEALDQVLADVDLQAAPVVLEAGDAAAAAESAGAFLALAEDRRIAPQDLPGTLGLDPLGLEARQGAPQDLGAAIALAARAATRHPRLRTLVADGLPYAEAGATDTEELGCVVATGIAYLRALAERGVTPTQAAAQLELRLAAGPDQFLTIAKLRAARRLWARVTEVTGDVAADARPPRVHAVSSPAMLTRRDPWVNLLRVTIAVFAAGVGGAGAITALPFDHALGHSDAFARRIARNTPALLQEESELARVLDPAGGAWYVEQLSDQVARAAWAWMQEIERAGGQGEALRAGLVADWLDRSRAARYERIRRLRQPITGVSTYPDLEERAVVRTPRAGGGGGGLPAQRYAEPFEALRDRADAVRARTGEPPTVFLATLGNQRQILSARNLLAAGGIACDVAETTDGPAQVLDEYRKRRHPVAVLCGAGDAPLATALKEAGAARVAFFQEGGDAIRELQTLLAALEPVG